MGSVLLVFLFFLVFPGKTKKTKKTKMAEPMSQCLAWGQYFCFFCFFWFSQVKPKKNQNGRTYVPVSGMGSVLLFFFVVFLVFPGKTKKTKKNKMAEPMSQCLAWGQYFCFFLFFLVFPGKTKKTKKPKWQNLCPSAWHGVSTFVFLCFFGFCRGFCNFLVSDMGSAILLFCFSRFLQYSAFPKKTLVSFPKKTFFS